jgi:hypothetical protein
VTSPNQRLSSAVSEDQDPGYEVEPRQPAATVDKLKVSESFHVSFRKNERRLKSSKKDCQIFPDSLRRMKW